MDFAKKLAEMGINRIIVTDVNRNGMLEGPNIELCKTIADATNTKVTLSGGISSYKDLIEVQKNSEYGIDSVIIGRAFMKIDSLVKKCGELLNPEYLTNI